MRTHSSRMDVSSSTTKILALGSTMDSLSFMPRVQPRVPCGFSRTALLEQVSCRTHIYPGRLASFRRNIMFLDFRVERRAIDPQHLRGLVQVPRSHLQHRVDVPAFGVAE